jgi:hypothetical protein
MKLDRRRFLRGSLVAAITACAGLGVAAVVPAWRSKLRWMAQRMLELPQGHARRLASRLHYLKFERADLERFIADWERYVGPLSRWHALPPELDTRLLLSSDFFQNGADESKPVRYVAFYDPYVSTCSNPLAQLD